MNNKLNISLILDEAWQDCLDDGYTTLRPCPEVIKSQTDALMSNIKILIQTNEVKAMNKHLDNVCIMQKHNDSENVLKLRKEFQESEKYIIKAVNCHDDFISLAQSVMKLDCPEHIHVMAYQLLKKASQ